MLSILIDPARLGAGHFFGCEASAFIEWVKQSPPAPGFDKVRIAGDPERETRVKRARDGIEVDATTWKDILAAGEKVGLAAAQTERAARG
jgi:hydroxycarboxylate dehydrogenase B